MTAKRQPNLAALVACAFVALAYAGAFAWALARGESAEEYVFIAVVLALIFPLATWLSTMWVRDVAFERPAGAAEVGAALAIVAVISLLLIPGPARFASWIAPAASPLAHELLIVAVKLSMFVVFPALVLVVGFRRGLRDFGVGGSRVSRRRAALVFLVGAGLFTAVQFVFGSEGAALKTGTYAAETLTIVTPLVFVWMSIEAGLVEEFFFRAVLQERLAQALKSPLAAALIGSLLFGLAHAPGLALRGEDGWAEAILHSVLVLAPAGFAMAFLWMRTRNLLLVALIHGAGDVIPNFAHIGEITGLIGAR